MPVIMVKAFSSFGEQLQAKATSRRSKTHGAQTLGNERSMMSLGMLDLVPSQAQRQDLEDFFC
jgi:hypothetical protein